MDAPSQSLCRLMIGAFQVFQAPHQQIQHSIVKFALRIDDPETELRILRKLVDNGMQGNKRKPGLARARTSRHQPMGIQNFTGRNDHRFSPGGCAKPDFWTRAGR